MLSVRKLKKAKLKQLRLKDKDRLAFVHQTVYNTGPVKMIKKSSQDGSISASYQKFVKLLFKVHRDLIRIVFRPLIGCC